MARKRTTEAPSNDPVLDAIVDAKLEKEEAVPVAPDADSPAVQSIMASAPEPGSPEWQPFVMSQFDRGDFDPEGNPTADACRIVAMRVLGPVVGERIRTVQVPEASNGYRGSVEVSISIAWGGDKDDVRVFEDVCEVYPGNTPGGVKYSKHCLASSKTKSLGRAYRSALALKKVYVAEEMVSVPDSEAGLDKYVVDTQIVFLDRECRDLDIDVMKFINEYVNEGAHAYKDITHMRYERAGLAIEKLQELKRGEKEIPPTIQGYDPSFRKGK